MKKIFILFILLCAPALSYAQATAEDVAKQLNSCISQADYECLWNSMASSSQTRMSEQLELRKSDVENQNFAKNKYGIDLKTLNSMTAKEFTITLFSYELSHLKGLPITSSNIMFNDSKDLAIVETNANGIRGQLRLQKVEGKWLVVF